MSSLTPVFILLMLFTAYTPGLTSNLKPIIGVLSQEYRYYQDWNQKYSADYDTQNQYESSLGSGGPRRLYIAGSYISYVEGAGARAVPIWANGDREYLKKIFRNINGLLLPGGSVPLDNSLYAKSGRYLLQLAKKANDQGDYFPVWGTCLGFEFLLYAAAGFNELRANCQVEDVADSLQFTPATSTSRLFGNAPSSILSILESQNVTINFHRRCITPANLTQFGLDQEYKILSLNYDPIFQLQYISSVEHKTYPFYATQFHPEKNIYEWTTKEKNIPHTPEAIAVSQFLANFFIGEARKNYHSFESEEEANQYLIYNYQSTFTGARGSTFVETYFFPGN